MKLQTVSTGSKGNCYCLIDGENSLILDCGVPFDSRVKSAIGWNIKGINGVLCDHFHSDHFAFAKDYLKIGIKVYMPEECKTKYPTYSNAIVLKALKQVKIGVFKVTPFNVPHDAENYAYLIENEQKEKLLYMTDCVYCPYDLSKQKINHLLIECNYDKNLIDENYDVILRNRVIQTHMELNTCIGFIKSVDNQHLKNIILCHLSEFNSNKEHFLNEVQNITTKNVYIAKKGECIELTGGTKE